jgi:hypothetical protein
MKRKRIMLALVKSDFVQRLVGGFAFGAVALLATTGMHL